MIGTDTAIVRAAVMRFGVRRNRIFRCFVIVTYLLVEFNIGSYKHLLKTMFLAFFIQVHIAIFKHYLGINAFMALNTKANGMIVVNIIAGVTHVL